MFHVTFFKTHYGHECELGYLTIPKSNRGAIAGQLLQKIPYDEILDKVRSTVNDTIDRIHLLSRKDILNIEAAYAIEGNVQRNSNDKLSVELWVREMMAKEDNPVIYYKQQGEESDILQPEDFALAIMSKAQAELLKKFGTGSIVCMDSTHGTNGYDFGLTTVMVVDDFGEGFPVAFFYSNRENYTALKLFCNAISQKAGQIHANVFMSDDADQFYAAWSSTMNNVPQKLLCIWHVDRAWRGKISSIKNTEMQKSVYRTLRMVLEETDIEKFYVFLEKAVAEFLENPDTKPFGEYFKLNYANRPSSWAYCHRIGKGINTNMYLESLHKVIKHIYLKGRVAKRLDKSIHALMRLVRDKQFDRIIKLTKGKVTAKISAMHDRHKTAKTVSYSTIAQVNDCEWTVPSFQKRSKHEYSIRKKFLPTGHVCEISCKVCKICTHMYSCSCTDHLIKNMVCKHIHLLGIKLKEEGIGMNIDSENHDFVSENVADNSCNSQSEMQLHLKTLHNPLNDFDVLQNKIVEDCQAFVGKIKLLTSQTTGLETLKAIQSHCQVMNALAEINVMPVKKDSCPAHTHEPANKRIKLQDRYRSTKHKREKGTGLRKPTTDEKKEKEKEYMV